MRKTLVALPVVGLLCALSPTLTFANHRAGDFPLPEQIATGDFNRDGKVDLAVNLSGFDNVAILLGDGLGNFTLKSHLEADTLSKGIAVGDINSDGKLDLLSINQWGYDIKVHLGDGAGGFQYLNRLNGDGEPTRLELVDVNHDGFLDIVANAPSEAKVLIYLGNGLGGFSNTATELEGAGKNDFAIGTGDFNQDNNVDIAVTNFVDKTKTGSHAQIFLGDGTGGFTLGQEFQINPEASDLAVADMNHDGNLDLCISGAGSENEQGLFISVYLGDGTGNFALQQTTDLGTGAIRGKISLGDFNEDGNTDIAIPESASSEVPPHEKSTRLLIFLNDGQGNLTQGQIATVGQEPHSAITGDFNNDGHTDVVVSNRSDGTISVLFGNGDGTFTPHATIPIDVLP
jgi:hypothetical protein